MRTQKNATLPFSLSDLGVLPGLPFLAELSVYADIRNGNISAVKEQFESSRAILLAEKDIFSNNPVSNLRYHFVIIATLTAKTCIDGGMSRDNAFALASSYIRIADRLTQPDEILDQLGKLLIDFATRMQALKTDGVMSIHVNKCIEYIYTHLHDKITLEDLAAHVGRHPSYLSKLFSEETGKSIHAFILDAKTESAKNLLLGTDLPYVDIALSLGFSSQSAFINVFRKRTGSTPKQFRGRQ